MRLRSAGRKIPVQKRALLLSIQPRYADKIFAGTKRVELRRVRPKVEVGDLVLVYVSTPVKALTGAFEVKSVISAHPSELWALVKNEAGVTREEFFTYYAGAPMGYGIRLKKAWSLPTPIALISLRRAWSKFRPPQSYHYLPSEIVTRIAPPIRAAS